MHQLRSFHTYSDISIRGDLAWQGKLLTLRFEVEDAQRRLLDGLGAPQRRVPGRESRRDGLWKTTCFEAFWARPRERSYWELNLAGDGGWNLYHFEDYRVPQPPRPSEDFRMESWETKTSGSLECALSTSLDLPKLEASICVIARTEGATHYFSTRHAGEKPDYHLRAGLDLSLSR